MTIQPLTTETFETILMCAVCVSDRSGAQIALSIIVLTFVLLGIANWAWKKYFSNKRQILTKK